MAMQDLSLQAPPDGSNQLIYTLAHFWPGMDECGSHMDLTLIGGGLEELHVV